MSTLHSIATIGWPEMLMAGLVILLLFGATKIPQLMRGLGQGIGEFKKGLKDGQTEEEKKGEEEKKP